MGAGSETARYRFEGFTLDLARGALTGPDGEERPLRPKSFALLHHLVAHAGRVVPREELMEALWPGVFVTDDGLTQCVKEVRRALGDEAQAVLRTLPRRGYLFAAAVSRAEAARVLAPTAATSPAADAPPVPPTGRPMLVVLPFEAIGEDEEQGWFAEGLTADLVTDLTRFQSLHVVSPVRRRGGPARALPETPWTADPAPAGASYLVSGSVRRAGGRIRVTVQFEDAETGVSLWAERLDRPLEDLFAVQEEIADRIAARLVAQVDHESLRRAKRRAPASLDAYELVLRGRELHGRATEAGTIAARAMFDRAIAADPNYATAHAWQAFTIQRGFTHHWGEPRGRAALAPALAHAQRAAELEPDSPLCLSRLAFVLTLHGRTEEAIEIARAAVRLNPCAYDSRADYAMILGNGGQPAEAVRQFRIVLALDPFHPPARRAVYGKALLLAGEPEAALAELRWAAARVPDYRVLHQALAVAAVETGRIEEARAAVRELLRINPALNLRTVREAWFHHRKEDEERMLRGLRAAGLPEG